ncbi:YcaO-like family protein [Streptomyces sp. BH104]|uniref:YcaO-like family protein n=1 Tax=Streptomyces sp. BH104 TaxID=3410407 RepID=UPI003BB7AD52
MRLHRFEGTQRTRPPEETWQAIRPLLPGFGITRVADVTALDDLGIPVAMAIRPLSQTLTPAQGKGATLEAARVSAAMEAIEVWHAERAVPSAPVTDASARDLQLPYDVRALELPEGNLVTAGVRMAWLPARSLLTQEQVLVPAGAVRLSRTVRDDFRMHLATASTNGLASGNSLAEAQVHALCEVIERDVLSGMDTAHPGEIIDAGSVTDQHCTGLLERLKGCWLELRHVTNRFRVPVMTCHLWREDQSAATVAGAGCHPDPAIALSRAITEAVQTRLTHITGSREDCRPFVYDSRPHPAPRRSERAAVAWHLISTRYEAAPIADTSLALVLAGIVAKAAGVTPLFVDLTQGAHRQDEFAVVKVLAPGLRYAARHTVPRPLEAR